MLVRMFITTILIAGKMLAFPPTYTKNNPKPADAEYWYKQAKSKIQVKPQNMREAKNVIFFLGDAMSISTITAARVHLSQKEGLGPFEAELAFDSFPSSGFVKTHCLDQVTADSACSATAYLGGVRANFGTIGVSGAVHRKDCAQMNVEENEVNSIARLFQIHGRRTGIVTTASITDASPAGVYAHTADRSWQTDANLVEDELDPAECMDIASQLIYGNTGRNLNVIFAGGRSYFIPNTVENSNGEVGNRTDGRNLINEWLATKSTSSHSYVSDRNGLYEINSATEYALGLFNSYHMTYNLDRKISKEPSLKEMTKKAIELLSQSGKGYFLFVESARIDHAHHKSEAQVALDEMLEFNKAIEAAVDVTDPRETLIVVTADHSNTMTLSGYTNWSTPITTFGGLDDNNISYTIINYASGPGFQQLTKGKKNISRGSFDDHHYKYPTLALALSAKHGATDVGIFANGPWAHLFTGVMEQYLIPHKMAYAAGFGNEYD